MKIKLNTSLAGERRSYAAGETVEWKDEADAKRLIEAGHAVEVEEEEGKKKK